MLLQNARALGARFATAPLGVVGRPRSTAAATAVDADATHARSSEWERARPYSEMPGPKPYPLLGNLPRLVPRIGEYGDLELIQLHSVLRSRYGDIVKISNIIGRKDMVFLFDPKDIEKMLRNEGAWPIREGLKTVHYYRTVLRKEKYENAVGTITTQGKEWQDFRSKVNQPLMQPKSAKRYLSPINSVAEDFIGRMRELRDENKELPADFINDLYKWSLESIALVALDTRLGCLEPNLAADSEPQRMIDAVQVIFEGFYKLDLKPSLWRLVSTPMWRRLVGAFDYFYAIAEKYVNEATARKGKKANQEPSILERLMEEDPRVAKVMASDLLFGGVDTTSHLAASLLFHLAKNPDVQRKVGEEIRRNFPAKNTPMTEDIMNELLYLKACLKESLRVFPITMGNLRETPKDIVLGDYQVPKGVDIFLCHMAISQDEKHYPRPLSFEPERWLRGGPQAHSAHPFVTMPFGFGPRTCVGRRFAEMEVLTLVAKVLRNFWVEYHHGDKIEFSSRSINTITMPLKFRLLDQQ